MKILFLDFDDLKNPLLAAGQARATYEVGKRLVQFGHQVVVLCSKYPGSDDRTEEGIHYRHIGVGTKNIKFNNAVYALIAGSRANSVKADIIVECFTAPASVLGTPLFTKTPVVALPTSFDAPRFSRRYHLPFTLIEKLGSRWYKYFMPYTEAYKKKMESYNPTIISKTIPEGVGDEFFQITHKKSKYILCLGRLDMTQKGLDLLLEAYALAQHRTPYPLVIAGNGPDEQKVRELVTKYQLDSRVSLVGPAYGEKKAELLSQAAFVVMPSRNEGFSLFSLEALASGNPLVVFDIPGFSWTQNSLVVSKTPAYDVKSYADAMVAMSKSVSQASLRTKTRQSVRNYTWTHVAQSFESFFKEVLLREKQVKGAI